MTGLHERVMAIGYRMKIAHLDDAGQAQAELRAEADARLAVFETNERGGYFAATSQAHADALARRRIVERQIDVELRANRGK